MQTPQDLQRIILKYWKEDSTYFSIPFSEIQYENDSRILELIAIQFCWVLKEQLGIDFGYILGYDDNKVYLYKKGDDFLTSKFAIAIPYGERDRYISFIAEVNALVGEEGAVTLCVNNNPYVLQSYLLIETKTKQDEIKRLVLENSLSVDTSKGYNEIFTEMCARKWDIITFPKMVSENVINDLIDYLFVIPTVAALKEKGFDGGINVCRKKIFISYCHADKEEVYPIVDKIVESGIDAWIDREQIDVGDNILERVSQGIRECDVSILFLSKSTKTSLFARHELNTFFNRIIDNTQNKWFLIKLDTVNPEDIYPGLGRYLYYDYYTTPDIEELIGQLRKVISKANNT